MPATAWVGEREYVGLAAAAAGAARRTSPESRIRRPRPACPGLVSSKRFCEIDLLRRIHGCGRSGSLRGYSMARRGRFAEFFKTAGSSLAAVAIIGSVLALIGWRLGSTPLIWDAKSPPKA